MKSMKSDNPFEGWDAEHQTVGMLVEFPDYEGGKEALKYCALGWLEKVLGAERGGPELIDQFVSWIYERTKRPIIEWNDIHRKPPAWFYQMWDAFLDWPMNEWPINIQSQKKGTGQSGPVQSPVPES